jgi:hypothetical protein
MIRFMRVLDVDWSYFFADPDAAREWEPSPPLPGADE